eukprot:CAMPEP_0170557628 /NCGR_PEP_ID=MMETSP0211-20121228/28543_1 /TAXON_ID=311385 /ORGANISM="Pseudokeronopsis sp., Strain OXSARD2" /LENGTH=43 /DNA_ID= /DNA_START= /DNA_END= /DNA_ORIENTATION=
MGGPYEKNNFEKLRDSKKVVVKEELMEVDISDLPLKKVPEYQL